MEDRRANNTQTGERLSEDRNNRPATTVGSTSFYLMFASLILLIIIFADMNMQFYNNIILFTLATATTLTGVFLLGSCIPKHYKSEIYIVRILAAANLMLGIPAFSYTCSRRFRHSCIPAYCHFLPDTVEKAG